MSLPGVILGSPESTKVRIAVCCIDFVTKNLTAIDDLNYLNKLKNIENYLISLSKKPDLIIFPEGAGSPGVIALGNRLVTILGTTTVCGTRLDSVSNTVVCDVIGPNGNFSFEKQHLSPYDNELSDVSVYAGKSAGGQFSLNLTTQTGRAVTIFCQIYICYDLHYINMNSSSYVPLIVVPMFHTRWDQAQKFALEIVKKYHSRLILVNKNRSTVIFNKDRKINNDLAFASWLTKKQSMASITWTIFRLFDGICSLWLSHWKARRFFLASSAHGPMNRNDEKNLKGMKLRSDSRSRRIWMNFKECVQVGDYEVGIETTDGHENRFGTGFFYSGFEEHSITDKLDESSVVPLA